MFKSAALYYLQQAAAPKWRSGNAWLLETQSNDCCRLWAAAGVSV
jgi:hypothetical protein